MGTSFNAMHTTLMAIKKQSELEVRKRSVSMEPLLSLSLPTVPSAFPSFLFHPFLSFLAFPYFHLCPFPVPFNMPTPSLSR